MTKITLSFRQSRTKYSRRPENGLNKLLYLIKSMTEKCIFRFYLFLKSYSCVLQTFSKNISLALGKTITQTKATKPHKSVHIDFFTST